jgi:hypothetical protein
MKKVLIPAALLYYISIHTPRAARTNADRRAQGRGDGAFDGRIMARYAPTSPNAENARAQDACTARAHDAAIDATSPPPPNNGVHPPSKI